MAAFSPARQTLPSAGIVKIGTHITAPRIRLVCFYRISTYAVPTLRDHKACVNLIVEAGETMFANIDTFTIISSFAGEPTTKNSKYTRSACFPSRRRTTGQNDPIARCRRLATGTPISSRPTLSRTRWSCAAQTF